MYHQKICQHRLDRLASVLRKDIDPAFSFTDHSIGQVEEWNVRLDDAFDPVKGEQTRPLAVEEEAWVRHELSRCKADFNYWARRYAFLKNKDMSLVRFNPTPVQEILLDRIGHAELDAVTGKTGDGVLLAVMKARQVGISTISEIIISHRAFFYGHTTALVAADVPERTQNLYEMMVRILDNLPWWMVPRSTDPTKDYRVKGQQLYFHDQDSVIRMGNASNMQGGDSGAEKGSLGTGMTLPLCHLSELALWPNAAQIDDALMPSIPLSPRTFVVFESTAKGRNNWWHTVWMNAKSNVGRLKPVFIPWYLEPTYKLPYPSDWTPSETSTAHAQRVKNNSALWCGRSIDLTKEQLYWYERTRTDYASRKKLYKFLAEFTADDMEAFQNTRASVFGAELLDDIRQRANALPTLVEIRPRMSA